MEATQSERRRRKRANWARCCTHGEALPKRISQRRTSHKSKQINHRLALQQAVVFGVGKRLGYARRDLIVALMHWP